MIRLVVCLYSTPLLSVTGTTSRIRVAEEYGTVTADHVVVLNLQL
jgi:hypothetical protein